jgi:prepilin signal peptidase PulO-like enzyme (type II secretory pathway)
MELPQTLQEFLLCLDFYPEVTLLSTLIELLFLTHVILKLVMKKIIKFCVFFFVVLEQVLFSISDNSIVFASGDMPVSSLTPSPVQTAILATSTVDPASIGDTSGVIAIGLIVVFIILAGVVWGSLELYQESKRNNLPKE